MSLFTFLVIGWGSLILLGLSSILDLDDHHSAQAHDHGLGSFLSMQSFLLFGVGFGNVGAVGLAYGHSTTESMLLGVIFGVFLGVIGMRLMKVLKSTESDSTPRLEKIIGYTGTVVQEIPSNANGGFGEVVVNFHGQSRHLRARTSSTTTIPRGTTVKIVGLSGNDIFVIPLGA